MDLRIGPRRHLGSGNGTCLDTRPSHRPVSEDPKGRPEPESDYSDPPASPTPTETHRTPRHPTPRISSRTPPPPPPSPSLPSFRTFTQFTGS